MFRLELVRTASRRRAGFSLAGACLLTNLLLIYCAGCSIATAVEVERTPTSTASLTTEPTEHASGWMATSVAASVEATVRSEREPAVTPTPVEDEEDSLVGDGDWMNLPVLPEFSARARSIYRDGIERGNNPQAFSRIGDGEVATHWFLSGFVRDAGSYTLGPFPELQATIEFFASSIARDGQAARAGFNTTRILDPAFADRFVCERGESPLECELRINRPSIAILSLGTNQVWAPEIFTADLRIIIEKLIDAGVLPILSTKGDNLEGDHRINQRIADLAFEYQLPLWNFWRAIQPLPGHGLQPDGEHLTWAPNDFSDAEALSHAWPVRNLSALQLLQSVMEGMVP